MWSLLHFDFNRQQVIDHISAAIGIAMQRSVINVSGRTLFLIKDHAHAPDVFNQIRMRNLRKYGYIDLLRQ
jgi:hypothetical protein